MTFTTRLDSRSSVNKLSPGSRTIPHSKTGRIKVLHVINDLSIGGAEMTLYKLLSRMDRERFEAAVISLANRGKLRGRIEEAGVPVYNVGMNPRRPNPAPVWRLIKTARRFKPDLIQGWMAHGNLAAQVTSAFMSREVSVLWNIRQSLYSLDYEKPSTARVIKLCARLSHKPARIINNSTKSVSQHRAIGYHTERVLVIPNGFDTELFAPSEEARRDVRVELGVGENTFLIGRIGRSHPMKDHANFLHGAALLLKTYPDIQFVLAGKEVDWDNESLRGLVRELGLVERVHLLGERLDMPRLTAALDIASSSSYDEGFPNVIGEAMSCGVPCVATDVGDSQWIIGETGRVVPPRDASALSHAWEELVRLGADARKALGEAARSRVMRCFSLASVVEQYETLYESVIAERAEARKRAKDNLRYHKFPARSQARDARQDVTDSSPEVGRSASSRTG